MVIYLVDFVILNTVKHLPILLDLNTAYLDWIVQECKKQLKINLNSIIGSSHSYASKILDELELFQHPGGIFYLLRVKGDIVGMGALRKLSPEVGEIKRMYIKPDYQGKGYGKLMLTRLIKKGEKLGYTSLRLDILPFMKSAQRLYHSVGFVEIDEYPEAEALTIDGVTWTYMEKKL